MLLSTVSLLPMSAMAQDANDQTPAPYPTNLYIVGSATTVGYDAANAIEMTKVEGTHSFTVEVDLYPFDAGTRDFKFLTQKDWGGTEYGAAKYTYSYTVPSADSAEGGEASEATGIEQHIMLVPKNEKVVKLASGTSDSGYYKIATDYPGKYQLTVDLEKMELTFSRIGNLVYNYVFLTGSATPVDYSDESSLCISPVEENVFCGTLWLEAGEGKDFKILTVQQWGKMEFGAAADSKETGDVVNIPNEGINDQSVSYVLGYGLNDDEDYKKFTVSESGNYKITIDLNRNTATLMKSEYQDTNINFCTLVMVGSATKGGWDISQGTPLVQDQTKPYIYENNSVDLSAAKEGEATATFKLTTQPTRGYENQYFFFRNPEHSFWYTTNAEDDLQWPVTESGNFWVKLNTVDNNKQIENKYGKLEDLHGIIYTDNRYITTGVTEVEVEENFVENATYYNLQGQKVNNPSNGLFIEVTKSSVRKVLVR